MIGLRVGHNAPAQRTRRGEATLQATGGAQCAHAAGIPTAMHVRMCRMQPTGKVSMLRWNKARGKRKGNTQFSCSSRWTQSRLHYLPIDAEKPPPKPFDGSSGLKSPMPRCPPIGRQPPPSPFFFFDFELSLRLRVCMPSFFMVSGRLTCRGRQGRERGRQLFSGCCK